MNGVLYEYMSLLLLTSWLLLSSFVICSKGQMVAYWRLYMYVFWCLLASFGVFWCLFGVFWVFVQTVLRLHTTHVDDRNRIGAIHEKLRCCVTHSLLLTLTKSLIVCRSQTVFSHYPTWTLSACIISSHPKTLHTALIAFGKDNITSSKLKLNVDRVLLIDVYSNSDDYMFTMMICLRNDDYYFGIWRLLCESLMFHFCHFWVCFIVTCLNVSTSHVTVCICRAELKGFLLTYFHFCSLEKSACQYQTSVCSCLV